MLNVVINDGGRSKYFKAKNVGDCVTRAICNATGKDYLEVYNSLKDLAKHEHLGKHKHSKSSVRDGVYNTTWIKYIESLGWEQLPNIMGIGTGIIYHLNNSDLDELCKHYPRMIIQVSKHLTTVIDGNLVDNYDCTRQGTRGIYRIYVPKVTFVPALRKRLF